MGVGDDQCTNNNNKLSLYLYLYLHGTPLPEDRDIKDDEEEEGQYAPCGMRHVHVVCGMSMSMSMRIHTPMGNGRRKKNQHTGMLLTFGAVRNYSRLESCVLTCACAHVAREGSMSDVRACSVFASFL